MRDAIEEVLLLQTEYSPERTDAMHRRGVIVRTELAAELRDLLPALSAQCKVDDLRAEGRDGTGAKTEIPWTRIYSEARAPSATTGWYLVFLFSANGDRAYLSLNQGTTRWDGSEFKPLPEAVLVERAQWARAVLTQQHTLPSGWVTQIRLDNTRSHLGTGYELGSVIAREYPIDAVPSDEEIQNDLLAAASWLGTIYRANDQGLTVPGDPPEVADAEQAIGSIAEPRKNFKGPRLTGAERKAIEQRAVAVTREHFESPEMGYKTEDVGATASYDVHATRADEVVRVEVKGTTSDACEIVLTRNEVQLHRDNYPANALAIVRGIKLESTESGPVATGGELHLTMPWEIDEALLEPIAFRYTTGL